MERQSNLKAYVDGELPVMERLALYWHLLRCAKCREARTAMMEISRRLSVGESDTLDPELRSRILTSVSYTDRSAPQPPRTNYRRSGYPVLMLAGATAAGLLLIVMMTRTGTTFPPRDSAKMQRKSAPAPSTTSATLQSKSSQSASSDSNAMGAAVSQKAPAAVKRFAPAAQHSASDAAGGASPVGEPQAGSGAHAMPAMTVPPVDQPQFKKAFGDDKQQDMRVSGREARTKQYLNGAPPARQGQAAGDMAASAKQSNAYAGKAKTAHASSMARKAPTKSRSVQRARANSEAKSAPAAAKPAK